MIAKKVLLAAIHSFVRKSKTDWDDILVEKKVFSRLSHFAPAMVIYSTASLVAGEGVFAGTDFVFQKAAVLYMLLVGASVWTSFLSAVIVIYDKFDRSKERPIKSYVQILVIISYVVVAILAISMLLGKSPVALFTGLGAMSAILLLVFKDSILGFVAGIQLSANEMVQKGDWIEMPKYGADGDVIDVSLTTVKVQNWDKTISTIPTYALIADSFKNWRGMSDSGGRRIKRSISIDVNSVKFCDEEMLHRLSKIHHLTDYINQKKSELNKDNIEKKIDISVLANGRHLTNLGTFRAYILNYLRSHPKIHQNMTFLIRQLAITEQGVPLEIYVFSNDQNWVNYENIQADIFDHLLAVIPMFDLRVFQNPTGADFAKIGKN